MENRNILMTGATGFLGSNLLKQLLNNGYNISILKRSFSNVFRIEEIQNKITVFNIDEIAVEDCLKKIIPGIVIHCATDYGRKNIDPSVIIEANLILPLKLLELCGKYDVSCFINSDTALDKRINYYSLSKKQFRDWLYSYSSQLVCINVMLEHFYGPFDDKTKFVSFIIDKFLSDSENIDLTPGEQTRDFIYIKDVVNAFERIIENSYKMPKGNYNYGIGTNKQIKIKELVETTKLLTGNTNTKINFGAIQYRENEVMESHVDTATIRALGWASQYSLIEGLTKTIEAEKKEKL